jgi:UDP-N-acetylglucosamine 2-epimerase (non-hydrolysing)
MKTLPKVLIVFGTRPEAIKMAPVIGALKQCTSVSVRVCVTAQHRGMLDQVLGLFGIRPDHDLDLMVPGQTLSGLTARALEGLTGVIRQEQPGLVLVHGDTTTSAVAAMAAFYERLAVGHVEAGLRTHQIWSPWPEEFNRRVVGLVTALHFAPTEQARRNLLDERVPQDRIWVTGNTVIDALMQASHHIDTQPGLIDQLGQRFPFLDPSRRMLLVTGHRRENFGDGIEAICSGLRRLADRGDVQVVYPVHMNPNIKGPVETLLGEHPAIHLLPPQDYQSFVYLMKRAYLLLTDSGGIQEEAPALGKPVLVMRDTTERPEALEAGTARLVGTDADRLVAEASALLDNPDHYRAMATSQNPFGDGTAARQIADAVARHLEATQ